MGYTSVDWLQRTRSRSDMTSYLFHLTKGDETNSSIDVLVKILNDKKLLGSGRKGFISGTNRAVCFQDVPPYGLSQNCYHEQKLRELTKTNKVRYVPNGLALKKRIIFEKGGRPVIYEESQIAKQFLPPDEWWRIVDIDLSNDEKITDWTHEREWRLKGDLKFELEDVTVVLANKSAYKNFVQAVEDELIENIGGIIILDPVLS